jgi:hypothetical protein
LNVGEVRLCDILESVDISAFGALNGVDVVVVKSPDGIFAADVVHPIGSLGVTTVSNVSKNGKDEICALRSEKGYAKKIAAKNNALEITRPPLMIAK